MLTRKYPFHVFGLVLSLTQMERIVAKAVTEDGDEKPDAGEAYGGALPDIVNSCNYYTEAEGEFTPFDGGKEGGKYEGSFGIIRLDRTPSFFKSTYSSLDEMVGEIKGKVGKFLPDDFDYPAQLGQLVGGEWG